MNRDLIVARVDKARTALAEAKDAKDAKRVKDAGHAAKTYAKRQKLGHEVIDYAHAIIVDAEALMGEFIIANPPMHGNGTNQYAKQPKCQTGILARSLSDLGVTPKESSAVQFVARIAKYEPAKFEAYRNNQTTISKVRREVKKAEVTKKVAELPSDRFRVLYADPPWSYGNSGVINEDNYGHVHRHYPSMTIGELCAMDVKSIADDNAVMFMWVTSPLLDECWPVIRAWGFQYKTSFVWDKVKHNFGHYNSVRHEFLLICTRGSCTPDVNKLFDSVVSEEKSGKHSEKPEVFREMIDTIYPHGKRIELFARKKTKGWEVYGNEA